MDTEIFKALSDDNRLRILGILGSGESSACEILKNLNISQPTLSHHMKVLQSVELINVRKSGQWTYYSLNGSKLDEISEFIIGLKPSKA